MRRSRIPTLTLVALSAWLSPGPEARPCTVISVGKDASVDGSCMTSHTCDSHRSGSDVELVPHRRHKPGATRVLYKRKKDDSGPMERYGREKTGEIPQVAETFAYVSPEYAVMNEHQLAIGESTFGGRKELQSTKGMVDCVRLTQLVLERAKSARDAVRLAGKLVEEHGWIDEGEALTFADPDEVWHMEIVGPGKDKLGAVWAAQRIPDDHVSVIANGSRIGRIHLDRPDFFMASQNVTSVAEENGWWSPASGEPFKFYWAYGPDGRTSAAVTPREWRVLSLLAPSLKLEPGRDEYPFSVKPDFKVSPQKIMEILRDTFEGTRYDMVKDLVVVDQKTGKASKSPLANPFMPYDMNPLFKIHGSWGARGERPTARWYTMYAVITQSRRGLPDAVGGRIWFSYGNTAMTTWIPMWIGNTGLPESYRVDGRTTGFSRRSAWWAYNRVETLAAQRWGDMRKDVAALRDPLQKGLVEDAQKVETEAARVFKKNPKKARKMLTEFTRTRAAAVLKAYWDLGDKLWTKYDEKW